MTASRALFLLLLGLLACAAAPATPVVVAPGADARRLEVLFLGAPTANGPHHDPITRYRVLKRALGVAGINLTYSESLEEALAPAFLRQFDAVLLYANWKAFTAEQEQALLDYIAAGHGFLPIHCASACFGGSDRYIELVGARFQRHGGEVFTPVSVRPDHPILQGVGELTAWDETYVHDRHNDDRTVLQVRRDAAGDEPWTWVRAHGAGRIFYTASGHDHRVWDRPEFHALLRNAIVWAAGEAATQKLAALAIPDLPQQDVLLPGYRLRQAITRAQGALSPEDSAKLIQVPPGYEIALFAAEPDIVKPVHVAWDHRGRAFVIETVDYPNNHQAGNVGNDRIKICEDTDGDGRADKFTVFADGLSIPTSLVFVNGGVVATNGTQLIFLKDTNGDDVADVREVLIDGFSMHDTHAGPSNLRYGFDQWIYATIGYSGFKGQVGGRQHEFAQGLFRFKPDGSRLEFLQSTTNNTWGLGFTKDFTILGSTANGHPSWAYKFPAERYEALGLGAARAARADDNPLFFPSSMDIRQVDVHGGYTAACGHAFYTSRRFPAEYRERVAFIAEPTGKLIGQFDVAANGAGFTARQRPNNIFNSADAWTSPVCAEVGPDGALWVCDWYNLIVQHNPTPTVASAGMDAETGKGAAYVTPLRDTQRGRIWRVYPKGSSNEEIPVLDEAQPATLLAGLDHPNLLWRLHAQRLLAEAGHHATVPALRRLAAGSSLAAVHALYLLDGFGAADRDLLAAVGSSPDRGVRRAAREIAAQRFPDLVREQFLAAAALDGAARDARDWAELLVAVSRLDRSGELGARIFAAAAADEARLLQDAVLVEAWQIAARAHAPGLIDAALAADPSLAKGDQSIGGQVMAALLWEANASPDRRAAVLAAARRHSTAFAAQVAGGLAHALASTAAPARRHLPDPVIHKRGADIYANTCVACHGIDGQGVAGVFPPLVGSERLNRDPGIPIRIVLGGLIGPITVGGKEYNSAMPQVPGLTNQDIASVLTFVRQSFGNDAPPVSEAEVQAVRRAVRGRQEPWTAEELDKLAQ